MAQKVTVVLEDDLTGGPANEHGLAVSERGRIPAGVLEQYHAAADRS